ncbi:hypothetical protein BGZ81_001902 [Podila clonocystis]|nr:hypothetical protein BGZ81_001902 [Podila clonocystis]
MSFFIDLIVLAIGFVFFIAMLDDSSRTLHLVLAPVRFLRAMGWRIFWSIIWSIVAVVRVVQFFYDSTHYLYFMVTGGPLPSIAAANLVPVLLRDDHGWSRVVRPPPVGTRLLEAFWSGTLFVVLVAEIKHVTSSSSIISSIAETMSNVKIVLTDAASVIHANALELAIAIQPSASQAVSVIEHSVPQCTSLAISSMHTVAKVNKWPQNDPLEDYYYERAVNTLAFLFEQMSLDDGPNYFEPLPSSTFSDPIKGLPMWIAFKSRFQLKNLPDFASWPTIHSPFFPPLRISSSATTTSRAESKKQTSTCKTTLATPTSFSRVGPATPTPFATVAPAIPTPFTRVAPATHSRLPPKLHSPESHLPFKLLLPQSGQPPKLLLPQSRLPPKLHSPESHLPFKLLLPQSGQPPKLLSPESHLPLQLLSPQSGLPPKLLLPQVAPATQAPFATVAPATQAPFSFVVPAAQPPFATVGPATPTPFTRVAPATQVPFATVAPATPTPFGPATPTPFATVGPATQASFLGATSTPISIVKAQVTAREAQEAGLFSKSQKTSTPTTPDEPSMPNGAGPETAHSQHTKLGLYDGSFPVCEFKFSIPAQNSAKTAVVSSTWMTWPSPPSNPPGQSRSTSRALLPQASQEEHALQAKAPMKNGFKASSLFRPKNTAATTALQQGSSMHTTATNMAASKVTWSSDISSRKATNTPASAVPASTTLPSAPFTATQSTVSPQSSWTTSPTMATAPAMVTSSVVGTVSTSTTSTVQQPPVVLVNGQPYEWPDEDEEDAEENVEESEEESDNNVHDWHALINYNYNSDSDSDSDSDCDTVTIRGRISKIR